MRELTDKGEIQQYENDLFSLRVAEQNENNDFDLDELGNPETCECGNFINSRGHCPRCDY